MAIWNTKAECASREEIRAHQLKLLKKQVKYVYSKIPWYKKRFDAINLKPDDIQSLDDIVKIPFTDKSSFRNNFPFGLFAVDPDECIRLHSSSGTTGKPVVVGYTKEDLAIWTECISRMVTMAGVNSNDRAQMCFLYGMFTGGWGLHYGLENVGAMVIPAGAGSTLKHLEMIQDYKSTVLISTPSYAFHLGEKAKEIGFDIQNSSLRVGLFGGEPCPPKLRKAIEENLGIIVTNNYGLTELMGPGVSGECQYGNGDFHIFEDHFIPEIVDPDTGEPLDPTEEGELVLTSLTRIASPVLRYRTHDITSLNYEPCECGRTHVRMKPVKHRTDDMLIVKGVNIFPSQFDEVLKTIDGASSQWHIVITRSKGIDKLELLLEIEPDMFVDSMALMETFRKNINTRLDRALGIKIKVTLVEPGSLDRTQGKAKRVTDKRHMDLD